ncbi:MAG TPA: FAD-binding protein [Cyclobacteriaceae bacterium]|nr:FAD-binding protein [Cyclobacteriaceae bacterium]
MNKRSFLKRLPLLAGGVILSQQAMVACSPKNNHPPLKNWAGNLTYSTDLVHYPSSVEEVQELVQKHDKIKALGSRHSFNQIADSRHRLISLEKMNKVVALDKSANTITVEAGAKYGEFAPYLHENGYALPNLASLPHITAVGACTTATHGSGIKNSNLSSSVSAIEFVDASGNLITLSRQKDPDIFAGAVVGLGALGVVTKITLDLLPTFDMSQVVYLDLPITELENNFMELQSRGYSVSLFTDWKNKNINEVWIKSVAGEQVTAADLDLYGAKLASENIHPVSTQSAETVTDQRGIPGPWYERMPHFKMGFKPSTGEELQSEYFVRVEHAYEALLAMEAIHDKISPYLFISEIRTVKGDNFWMSPCYQKDAVAIHTTWKQDVDTVMGLIQLVEEQLAPFDPIPHWAKLFTMSPKTLQSKYEKLADFKQLVAQFDPHGKFRNDFLDKNLYS